MLSYSMTFLENEYLWVEKYRPQTIADCILPDRIKKVLLACIEKKDMQNMLFSSPAGAGKTSVARALARDLGVDSLLINAAEENGIEVLRTKIKSYASSVSLSGGFKLVILDEADRLTPQTQDALKAFIEEYSANCRFILTSNFKNKIIPPLHSRCTHLDFSIQKSELQEMAGKFMKRIKKILANENVSCNDTALAEIIMRFAPDWRRILNECQRAASAAGEINPSAIVSLSDDSVAALMKFLKDKDFRNMRKWVVENMDLDTTAIFRKVYDTAYDYVNPQSIPQLVLIIADYSYKSAFCADREVNAVAAFVEIMASIEFL